jgi:hypothetical protein
MSKRQMTTQRPANQQNRAVSDRRAGQLMAQLSGYLRSCQRGVRVAAAVLALGAVAALGGCGGEEHVIRYRITIDVDVNGETKSGSSVIQVLFYGGGGGAGRPSKYYTRTSGVAPVIDLGRRGWLVATMRAVDNERRQKASGIQCKQHDAEQWLDVFQLDAAELVKLRAGKRDLLAKRQPTFAWFPHNQDYLTGVQLCPEEFSRIIGTDVNLRSATIEIVPDAELKTKLDIDAQWLDSIRAEKNGSTLHGQYKPSLSFFERVGAGQ